MNEIPPNPEGVRRPVLIAIAVIALTAGGFMLMSMRGGKPDPVPEVAQEPTPTRPASVRPATPPADTLPSDPTPPPPAVAVPAPPPERAAVPRTTTVGAIPPGAEPSAETRRLVSTLANFDLNPANLTPEAAAAWKQNLQALVQNGAAAVPAIQEFLALNKDVNFDAAPGAANLLGSSTLRLSLLEALGNIGGPEAISLSAQALQSTFDPREIALLANSLERQAPEQYRDMAVAAARAALAQAVPGTANIRDVGPLFSVLTQYGGAAAVADFQQAASGQWKYYATIALGQMPDGAGLPALIQMAGDANNPAIGGRTAALQVLGQAAAESPEARNALLEQASRGTIPPATWINIAAALGGERFYIGTMDAQTAPNVRTWHLNYGNQNYYAVPSPLNAAQIDQRLALFDQFINANPGGPAVQILQDARNKLQSRIAP
jgi:hypothetical protein